MAIGNSLTTRKTSKSTFSTFMTSDAVKNKINQMIAGKDGNKFITSIISLVSDNPAIAECEHSTILASALLGESLKLSPSPQLGQYYIVPFKENNKDGSLKRTVAQFQIGYKGYIQLAIRSGYYKKMNVLSIKDGELVKYNPLDETIEADLIEDEEKRENTATIGYYAMFEYQNGFTKTIYWSKAKMEAHAKKYSQAYRTDLKRNWKYSFWSKDFDAMAYKTMLRQLISKWGIMSVEFQTAVTNDMAVLNDIESQPQFVDNIGEETIIEAEVNNMEESKDTQNDPFAFENE
ncbi:MAG: recombinase RecT [Candidatus Gastranaerophilales bacterium]|nr:recombinase RecT [Candidatus Gastranaerophilales bacterium]